MTIQLKKILHKNRIRIGIFFPADGHLNKLSRNAGAVFSRSLSCWHLPYAEDCLKRLKAAFVHYTIEIVKNEDDLVIGQAKPGPKTVEQIVKKSDASKQQRTISAVISAENSIELKKMLQLLTLKGYSASTVKTYKNEFAVFLQQIKKIPATGIDVERIKSYLQYCAETLHLSETAIHSRMNALKFYYEQVLGREKFFWEIPRPKKPLQLPKVISEEKILAGLYKTENIKHRVLLMTAYSAGLRVSEVVKLKLTDINEDRMQLFIERAKGKKDRMATLSRFNLQLLKEYLALYKPLNWIFEGRDKQEHLSCRTAQEIFKQAFKDLGLPPNLSFHSLRHSYATHLLENGTDIKFIQELLGHNDIKTTLRYTHVSIKEMQKIESPLDKIMSKQQLKIKGS